LYNNEVADRSDIILLLVLTVTLLHQTVPDTVGNISLEEYNTVPVQNNVACIASQIILFLQVVTILSNKEAESYSNIAIEECNT